jgi:hypothetical protein
MGASVYTGHKSQKTKDHFVEISKDEKQAPKKFQ